MSLIKSLLMTFGIFIIVWGAIFLNTNKHLNSGSSDAVTTPKIAISDPIELVGPGKKIRLGDDGEQVKMLWDQFYEARNLHMAVGQEASRRVFAYYEFTDSDLGAAMVTIGYNTEGMEIPGYTSLPTISVSTFEQIYENSESWDTTPGWKEVDEDREAHSLLEEYLMGAGGEVINAKVYVLYKQ